MPLFALCQVFRSIISHSKNSVEFVFALVRDSSPFHFTFFFCDVRLPASSDVTQSPFRSRNLKTFLKGFQILESFIPSSKSRFCIFREDYYRVAQCVDWKFRSTHCVCLLFNFSGLSMCHSRHFGFGIRNYFFM